jgi:hypothetical protein
MYEDLNQLVDMKFAKEAQAITSQARERATEMEREYAALTGSSGVRSGQHEVAIGRALIQGAEETVRALARIWTEAITRRNDHIARPDVQFILEKVSAYARAKKGHLHTALSQRRSGAVLNLLTQEANRQMDAVAADIRRDLEITVREHEAFPKPPATKEDAARTTPPDRGVKPMSHTAEVLKVLIASPSDVSEERDAVEKIVNEWNASHFPSTGVVLLPIRWETHAYPATGDRPQAIINKQIVESGDILIGIFGYKLGTPTGEAQSGTIEEIEEFRKAGKYVALYFSTADVPRTADRDQLEALEAYKKARRGDTLYFEFENTQGLRDHLIRHLPNIVQDVRTRPKLQALPQPANTSSALREAVARPASEPEPADLLADIISELEDNLDRASRPVTGEIYRRPSVQAWLQGRNKITLPPEIAAEVKNSYRQIDSWSDIVSSGLSPNTGSMQLNLIVTELRASLPLLVQRLRSADLEQKHTTRTRRS